MTDNQKKIQTMKLQDEINKLQEQLTLVTSQMETQQKDYTAKQVRKSWCVKTRLYTCILSVFESYWFTLGEGAYSKTRGV